MNKTKWIVFSLSVFLACSNVPDLGTDRLADAEFLIKSDSWTISYFWDKDHEETSDFSRYEFYFDDQEVFRALTPSGESIEGQWKRTQDDGLERLVIQVPGTKPLEELNDNWILQELNDSRIVLWDDRSDPEREELHFSRK